MAELSDYAPSVWKCAYERALADAAALLEGPGMARAALNPDWDAARYAAAEAVRALAQKEPGK